MPKRSSCPGLAILLLFATAAATAFVVPTTTGSIRTGSSRSTSITTTTTSLLATTSPIQSGNTVLVIGGTGGVGQLVTQKLLQEGVHVKVASRNVEQAQETINDDRVQVVELDLVNGNDQQLSDAMNNINGLVISVGTTAFPTLKWRGGNTPKAIDQVAVEKIVQMAASTACPSLTRICMVTSVGVDRTDQLPFLILNVFGVLDAKKAGEQALVQASRNNKLEYAIVRPGRLVGGPFTNTDVAQLLQIQGGATNGVDVVAGDDLLGDCKRDACAEAVVQCLTNPAGGRNVDFSIVSNDEPALTTDQWTAVFQQL